MNPRCGLCLDLQFVPIYMLIRQNRLSVDVAVSIHKGRHCQDDGSAIRQVEISVTGLVPLLPVSVMSKHLTGPA